MDCPKKEVEKEVNLGLSESAPASTSVFLTSQSATAIPKGTFGKNNHKLPPLIPIFNQQKSASCETIPILNGKPMRPPPPALPPPRPIDKHSRRRKFTATLRKSAHVSLVELTRAFKPQAVMYIIYNITQAEALQYNKKRGLTRENINWIYIRKLLPRWKSTDEIWAVGTDGIEHNCVTRAIGEDPVFGLQKSFMPTRVRQSFDSTAFTTFYYEVLLNRPVIESSSGGWLVTKHPLTGAIIDIT